MNLIAVLGSWKPAHAQQYHLRDPLLPPLPPLVQQTPPPREESLDIIPGGLPPPPISTWTGGKVTSHNLPSLDSPSTTPTNKPQEKPDIQVEFASLRSLIEANSNLVGTQIDLLRGEMISQRSEFTQRFDQLNMAVGRLVERVDKLEQNLLERFMQMLAGLFPHLQ